MLGITEPVSFRDIGLWTVIGLLFLDVYFRWEANHVAKRAAEAAAKKASQPQEISPQPLVIKPVDQYATKDELSEVREEIGDVNDDLQGLKEQIVRNGDERKKSIEGKVEGVRLELSKDIEKVSDTVAATNVELGEVRGEMKQVNLTLINLNSSLQNLQQNRNH